MSTSVTSEVEVLRLPRNQLLSLASLGWKEGRRIVLSPVLAIVLGFMILMGGVQVFDLGSAGLPDREGLYVGLTFAGALYAGLLFYLAAHLVTSSARRTHAERQLAASVMSSRRRSAGLCWGVVVGPGVLVGLLMALAAWLGSASTTIDGEPTWSAVGLVQIVMTVLGGALFGVMVATWLRFPGSLPLGLVALVFGTVVIADSNGPLGGQAAWFAPYVSEPTWIDDPWTLQGSQGWHVVYLACLCGLAVCGTMLREREGRGRWLALSAGWLAITATVGWLQLS